MCELNFQMQQNGGNSQVDIKQESKIEREQES